MHDNALHLFAAVHVALANGDAREVIGVHGHHVDLVELASNEAQDLFSVVVGAELAAVQRILKKVEHAIRVVANMFRCHHNIGQRVGGSMLLTRSIVHNERGLREVDLAIERLAGGRASRRFLTRHGGGKKARGLQM